MDGMSDHVTAVLVYRQAFTREECDGIREVAATLPEAHVGVYPAPEVPVRRARTKVLVPNTAGPWIEARIQSFARAANERFGFALDEDVRPVLCVSYGVGGYFDWHTDLADGAESTRKISLSVQLTAPEDYDGGALQFVSHGQALPAGEIGTLVAFPSHLAHRVLPVTRGERQALVAWVHGPSFR